MKTVSLRQFQQKPSQFLKELPITLTIYNKPICVISAVVNVEEKKESPKSMAEAVNSNVTEYSICPKHGSMFRSCGCSY